MRKAGGAVAAPAVIIILYDAGLSRGGAAVALRTTEHLEPHSRGRAQDAHGVVLG